MIAALKGAPPRRTGLLNKLPGLFPSTSCCICWRLLSSLFRGKLSPFFGGEGGKTYKKNENFAKTPWKPLFGKKKRDKRDKNSATVGLFAS